MRYTPRPRSLLLDMIKNAMQVHVLAFVLWFPLVLGDEAAISASQPLKPAPVETQKEAPPPLPDYQNVRYEENWPSWEGARRQGWNRLKAIPLGPQSHFLLTLGGQIRVRGEWWNDFAFSGSPQADDGFGLLRVRLHGELRAGRNFRFFVEGKSALADGRRLPGGNRTLDTDSAAFQNVLLEWRQPLAGDAQFSLLAGRQELQFGKQRLVSPLDWSNTRPRSFDGFRGVYRGRGWRVDGFWARHVRTRKYRFNPHDTETDLFGIYAARRLKRPGWAIDLYWLGLDRRQAGFVGLAGQETRQTLGLRLEGRNQSGFDFEVESAYQFGSFADQSIRAWMWTGVLGRTFAVPSAPRFYLALDFASGDSDPQDGNLNTFNQLFPLGHAYLGFADLVGRQNVLDFSQGGTFKPHSRVSGRVDYHLFWRATEGDALYNAGGGVVRNPAPGLPRRVGSELDLTLTWRPGRHTLLAAGYSHFFAGPFIEASGEGNGLDFSYLMLQYTF